MDAKNALGDPAQTYVYLKVDLPSLNILTLLNSIVHKREYSSDHRSAKTVLEGTKYPKRVLEGAGPLNFTDEHSSMCTTVRDRHHRTRNDTTTSHVLIIV